MCRNVGYGYGYYRYYFSGYLPAHNRFARERSSYLI